MSTITSANTGIPASANTAAPPIPIYVATDLSVIAPEPPPTPADVTIDGRIYRRLDPLYYAWLRSRVTRARQDRDAGKLASSAYDSLHRQFMGLHEAAVRLLGEPALRQGCATFDPHAYRPPGWRPKPMPREIPRHMPPPLPSYLYPPDGEWKFHEAVTPEAIAKVDAIRDIALCLDWTRQRLYQNRSRFGFPLGHDWGLVCFVPQDSRLGRVTGTHIEIIHGHRDVEHTLRFMNPDKFPPRQSQKEVIVK
jgi:hypothetical protein